ncbi:hypothetical protein [Rhodanobacter sp. C05]|uniref:hypothetical protein n=1 Tax=Rhodanobacter sp. C05 TaxID=1945855 RepID=UPI0009863898|nr:hypothetical protein [Rhodanobacter sp. C05]OOG39172.1 hypothetical protein B0E51_11440 [Rhodanobacter sp. C05]
MESSALTFVALNEKIEALPLHPSFQISPSRKAKWGIALVAIAGVLALILGKALPAKPWVLALVIVLLIVEIMGLVLVAIAELPGMKLTPAVDRREFAEILDFDMPHHDSLVAWLRTFPRERLEAMSAFASLRTLRMQSKLPLLTGNLDKLGALPVFAALIIQFKDMHWPPQPSWSEVILFGALMFVYWLTMLQVGARLRLELYDLLLKKALTA